MHKKSHVLIALVVAFVAVVSISAPAAFAKTTNDVKPGWGFGDQNHIHTGPPGQSVRPTIVQRLEDRENSIVTKLGNNNNIPEPQKTDIINQIKSIFDNIISMFS
jgi:hypothetical protein